MWIHIVIIFYLYQFASCHKTDKNNKITLREKYMCSGNCISKCCPKDMLVYKSAASKIRVCVPVPVNGTDLIMRKEQFIYDATNVTNAVNLSSVFNVLEGIACERKYKPNHRLYLQGAALSSLEREAKENVYAVLDPHIQYDITINKHGEPPKHLSLSKPLTHQRTHAFDPQNVAYNDFNNNNDLNDNRFSTFKTGSNKVRKSKKNNERKINTFEQNYVCKTNNDIEYSKNPFFGMVRDVNDNIVDIYSETKKPNENKSSNNNSRMYERNNSGRNVNVSMGKRNVFDKDLFNVTRSSDRSRKDETDPRKERTRFEESKHEDVQNEEDFKPRPGKVREIASRFNRNSIDNLQPLNLKKQRPKPLQSYGHQAYLDHIFPDAVEI